jgi:hypothetical protein
MVVQVEVEQLLIHSQMMALLEMGILLHILHHKAVMEVMERQSVEVHQEVVVVALLLLVEPQLQLKQEMVVMERLQAFQEVQ